MPTVANDSKGRANLFATLDCAGAHFIRVGSSSSDEGEENLPLSVAAGEQKGVIGTLRVCGAGQAEANCDSSRQQQQFPSWPPDRDRGDAEDVEAGPMSVRYSRVTSADGGDSSPTTEAERSKRKRSQLADRISNKLHALFWAVVGVIVVYRTDFVRVLMEDERVNRIWFNIGVVCFSINMVILVYLTVWLPHVRGIRVSWNVYSPRAIPTATVVGLICALALNVSLWDVWGFLTPLILFAVFIGCLFSLHFVPWPC